MISIKYTPRRLALFVVVLIGLAWQTANAQTAAFGYANDVQGGLKTYSAYLADPSNENARALKRSLSIERNLAPIVTYILATRALPSFVQSARQDIQNGSSPGSVGTTSLVSKGVSSLLGVALEDGAVSRSASGSTTTLTVNPAQMVALATKNINAICHIERPNCTVGELLLAGFSVSASFNTSSTSATSTSSLPQATLSALTGTTDPAFSGFTVRQAFNVRNKNIDPAAFKKAVTSDQSTTSAVIAFGDTASQLQTLIASDPGYIKNFDDCTSKITVPGFDSARLPQAVANCEDQIATAVENIPAAMKLVPTFEQENITFQFDRDAALNAVVNSITYSIEYDFANVLNQPTQSTFKLVYSQRADASKLQITANGSASIYNSLEGSSLSRFRSAQAALELDYKPTSTKKLQAAYGGGYYFQDMISDGLLTLPATALAPGTAIALPGNASVLLNTVGPIHIGQGKITFSIKGSNVSIPLAITFSNRTDLIKASRVVGNFGISYDFSSIFGSGSK